MNQGDGFLRFLGQCVIACLFALGVGAATAVFAGPAMGATVGAGLSFGALIALGRLASR